MGFLDSMCGYERTNLAVRLNSTLLKHRVCTLFPELADHFDTVMCDMCEIALRRMTVPPPSPGPPNGNAQLLLHDTVTASYLPGCLGILTTPLSIEPGTIKLQNTTRTADPDLAYGYHSTGDVFVIRSHARITVPGQSVSLPAHGPVLKRSRGASDTPRPRPTVLYFPGGAVRSVTEATEIEVVPQTVVVVGDGPGVLEIPGNSLVHHKNGTEILEACVFKLSPEILDADTCLTPGFPAYVPLDRPVSFQFELQGGEEVERSTPDLLQLASCYVVCVNSDCESELRIRFKKFSVGGSGLFRWKSREPHDGKMHFVEVLPDPKVAARFVRVDPYPLILKHQSSLGGPISEDAFYDTELPQLITAQIREQFLRPYADETDHPALVPPGHIDYSCHDCLEKHFDNFEKQQLGAIIVFRLGLNAHRSQAKTFLDAFREVVAASEGGEEQCRQVRLFSKTSADIPRAPSVIPVSVIQESLETAIMHALGRVRGFAPISSAAWSAGPADGGPNWHTVVDYSADPNARWIVDWLKKGGNKATWWIPDRDIHTFPPTSSLDLHGLSAFVANQLERWSPGTTQIFGRKGAKSPTHYTVMVPTSNRAILEAGSAFKFASLRTVTAKMCMVPYKDIDAVQSCLAVLIVPAVDEDIQAGHRWPHQRLGGITQLETTLTELEKRQSAPPEPPTNMENAFQTCLIGDSCDIAYCVQAHAASP